MSLPPFFTRHFG